MSWSVAAVAAVAAAAAVVVAGMPHDPSPLRLTAGATTTVPPTTPSTSSTPPTGSTTPTTAAPSTTVPTPTTSGEPLPREALTVVVANAGGQEGLAGEGAFALVGLGYVFVVTADAAEVRTATAVLFAPGREAEAERLADDLGLPASAVAPFDDPSVTTGSAEADLVVLLSTDVDL